MILKKSLCSGKTFLIIFSFLIPFSVYIIFLCPTIAGGDSPELITAAYILGIPHPPGYPLYTLLGKLFTFIPVHSIAWRVNLLSAFLDSLSCMFLYLSLEKLTKNPIASLSGSWFLAFSRYFWHYSEVAEVFPLNNFFVSLLIYILIIWREKSKNHVYIYLLSFIFGLSLTNHHTIILLLPPAVFFIIYHQRNILRQKKVILTSAILFFFGLLPYIYLPLSALREPPLNWNNPASVKNFKSLVLRENYGSMSLIPKKFLEDNHLKPPSLTKKISVYLASFYYQFGITGLLLGITGFVYVFFIDFSFAIFLVTAFFFTGLFFISLANMPFDIPVLVGVLQRFYIMSAVIFSYSIGFGAKGLYKYNFIEKFMPVHFFSFVILFLCLLVPFMSNLNEADFRDNYLAFDYARNILISLPPDSILIVKGDLPTMTVDYLQMAEGFRRDIKVICQVKLRYAWYTEQIKKRYPDIVILKDHYEKTDFINFDIVSLNIKKFDIFSSDLQEIKDFREVPWGLVRKIVDRKLIMDPPDFAIFKYNLRNLEKPYEDTSWEHEIRRQYWFIMK